MPDGAITKRWIKPSDPKAILRFIIIVFWFAAFVHIILAYGWGYRGDWLRFGILLAIGLVFVNVASVFLILYALQKKFEQLESYLKTESKKDEGRA